MLEVIGPQFKQRPGGYTKIINLGNRTGDQAPMVTLMFVENLSSIKPVKVIDGEKPGKKAEKKIVIKKEIRKKPEVKKKNKE